MKKVLSVLLLALLLAALTPGAFAEGETFAIDERAVLQGMSRSWLQGYEPGVTNNKLTLIVPIAAEGELKAAELLVADEAVSPFKPQSMGAAVRQEGGVWALRFNLQLHPDRENGDYPCAIRVSGDDGQTTDIPYTLRIRDGLPNTETARVEISSVQAELTVGEEGLVTARLRNPCRSLALENLTLTFSDQSGEILPKESNILRIPDLLPGEETDIELPVTVLPNAAVAPHSLQFSLSWTTLGAEKSQAESFTLPVRQEIRLEQGGLRMAETVVAGDSLTVSLPLMNMGKAEIVNAMVTVSLPGLTERQSVLVGSIAPGETKQGQLTLSPGRDTAGEYEGSLTVECEDNDGNKAGFSLPIRLTVEAPSVTETFAQQTPTVFKQPKAVYILSGVCAVLAVLLALQGILLRKKIYRLEEEKL